MSIKNLFKQAAGVLLALALASTAGAQQYPDKVIRLVTSDGAGGTIDILARIMAEEIGSQLGQTVAVDNKPGASGMVAAAEVAKSRADGYTLLFTPASTATIVPFLFRKLPYDYKKDLVPISQVATVPLVLFVPATSTATTLQDVVAKAKSQGGKMNVGAYGPGSLGHLTYEMIRNELHLKSTFVPYKSAQNLYGDIVGGQLDVVVDTLAGADPYVKSGRIKPLVITSKERFSLAPQVPTVAENGLKNFETTGWLALFAPNGTPPAIVATLQKAAAQAAQRPQVKERMAQFTFVPTGTTSQGLADVIASEQARFEPIVKALGLHQQQ